MSYDIEVYTKQIHHSANYTSNVAPMYYLAYTKAQALEDDLYNKGVYKWHELTFSNFKECLNGDRDCSLRALKLMIQAMEESPEEYKELNPDNGWGNYEGALKFLKDAYIALLENEYSYIEIDC